MRRTRPQTSSMFIVTVSGAEFAFFNDFRFTSFSGIKDETVTFPYTSPFLHRQYQIPSYRRYKPVTLEMPYNANEHSILLKTWNRYSNQPLQIRIEPITGCSQIEEVSLGYAHNISGAMWVGCDTVKVNRDETQITKVRLDFTFTSAEELEL